MTDPDAGAAGAGAADDPTETADAGADADADDDGAAVAAAEESAATTGVPDGPDESEDADGAVLERWTAAWSEALWSTGHVAMSRTEAAAEVADLTHGLATALRAEPFDPEAACGVGSRLVELHFVAPEALGAAVAAVAEHGPALQPPADVQRLGAVQAALTVGFVRALHQRTVGQQEAARRADLVGRRQVEASLGAELGRLRQAIARAAVGVCVVGADGLVSDANPSLARLVGREVKDCLLAKVTELLETQDARRLVVDLQRLLESQGTEFRTTLRFRHKQGYLVRAAVTGTPVTLDTGGAGVLLAVEDASRTEALELMLADAQEQDQLTYVLGRPAFLSRLASACTASAAPVALCLVDLAGFGRINAEHGFGAGDRLLRAVAERLHTRISGDGGELARVDGDVFAVMFSPHSPQHARRVTDGVHAALEEPFPVGGARIRVGATVGVAVRDTALADPEALLAAAETALRQAKESRGTATTTDPEPAATVTFAPPAEADGEPTRRLHPLPDFVGAIARDELFLLYQPVVALVDHAMRGVAVQVRWNHPAYGLLGPAEILRRTGGGDPAIAATLRRWIVVTACHQAEAWRRVRPAGPVFTALPFVLADAPLHAGEVEFALAASGLPAHLLRLRVREEELREYGEQLVEELNTVARRGVRVELAGVGGDRIDLAALRELPLRGMTLAPVPSGGPRVRVAAAARSRLAGRGGDGGRASGGTGERARPEVVSASIIQLGHGFGLSVTAEGVTSADQARRLHMLGCDLAQGRYFAEPGAPAAITARLTADPRWR